MAGPGGGDHEWRGGRCPHRPRRRRSSAARLGGAGSAPSALPGASEMGPWRKPIGCPRGDTPGQHQKLKRTWGSGGSQP
eukprot:995801-Pyramimonas_sp.AAC.2